MRGRGRPWEAIGRRGKADANHDSTVFTQEISELENCPGTIKKYRFRILFGARQGGGAS